MDRRFVIVLVLSAAFAVCVAAVLYRFAAMPHTAAVATRPVVVAAANLPLGTKMRKEDLKLVAMPESSLPKDSFSRLEDVVDRSVIGPMFQDEPVLKERIAAPGAMAGLAPMIADGQRAVSVRVNDVIGVAGFVQPGMRVDVVVTGRPPNSNDSVTRTVLQNVVVLSAGQVLTAEPKGQAINAAVVTLQVRPQDAEILILASGEGHIQLVLRNPSDSRSQVTSGTFLSALYGGALHSPSEPAPPVRHVMAAVKKRSEPMAPVAAAPIARTVEVVRGSRKSMDPVEPQASSLKLLN